jgi:cob(I)alamin adenosyltransferase
LRPSLLRFFLAGLLPVALFLLPAQQTRALTISEEDLTKLEATLTELETVNSQLQNQLTVSQSSLQKAETSFNAYAAEADKTALALVAEKQALAAQRDRWRTACLWGGVGSATVIAILVTFLVIK